MRSAVKASSRRERAFLRSKVLSSNLLTGYDDENEVTWVPVSDAAICREQPGWRSGQ
jgi:hypothetical protein